MAITKMITTLTLKEQFKALVLKLFSVYQLEISTSTESKDEVDLIITSDRQIHAAVELKLYRSRKVSLSTVENAIRHVKSIGLRANVSHLVLIVSANISDEWVLMAKEKHGGVILWDQNDLLCLAKKAGKGYLGLSEFLESVNPKQEAKLGTVQFQYRRNPIIDEIWSVEPKKTFVLSHQEVMNCIII